MDLQFKCCSKYHHKLMLQAVKSCSSLQTVTNTVTECVASLWEDRSWSLQSNIAINLSAVAYSAGCWPLLFHSFLWWNFETHFVGALFVNIFHFVSLIPPWHKNSQMIIAIQYSLLKSSNPVWSSFYEGLVTTGGHVCTGGLIPVLQQLILELYCIEWKLLE